MESSTPPRALPVYSSSDAESQSCQWERVTSRVGLPPCRRSLHAGAVWQDNLIIFGGYDGGHRVNDLYFYCFSRHTWSTRGGPAPSPAHAPPSPRDRHVACVWANGFYIFGGFDGTQRVNDLHCFDMETNLWSRVASHGTPPTPRHSHAAAVYGDSMYIFGGYDGSYRCDFHEFNFLTRTWTLMPANGDIPRSRYRGTCVVHDDKMVLHGGHDGSRHLQDTFVYDFADQAWAQLITDGPIPSPRDSHVSVVYGSSMFVFGGSTGVAMNDFHELRLDTGTWKVVPVSTAVSTPSPSSSSGAGAGAGAAGASAGAGAGAGGGGSASVVDSLLGSPNRPPLPPPNTPPNTPQGQLRSPTPPPTPGSTSVGARFCHVGVVYDASLYVFGGYDGASRLNDFLRLQFPFDAPTAGLPSSTLISDLRRLVNCDLLSDISFIVEGQRVFGHKVLCLRCPYFHNMLTGEYMESRATELVLEDIRVPIFLQLLEFLYSDCCEINVESAMELLRAADRFGVDRLKRLCEHVMLSSISTDTAAQILLTADALNAEALRDRCMGFILSHFDDVSLTPSFEEMTRANIELTLEIIRRRAAPRG